MDEEKILRDRLPDRRSLLVHAEGSCVRSRHELATVLVRELRKERAKSPRLSDLLVQLEVLAQDRIDRVLEEPECVLVRGGQLRRGVAPADEVDIEETPDVRLVSEGLRVDVLQRGGELA